MFGKLFSRKKLKEPVDLRGLKTDMHSHLVPGIDDGAPDMETAISLIKQFARLGYKKLITTPHISSDIFKNNPQIIQEGLYGVKKVLEQENINIKIEAAAEYLIDEGFSNLLVKGELQTFGDKYILIELPYFNAPPNLYDITFELQIKGYKIILAHPERYLYWYGELHRFEELKDRGIYFQMNMLSLSGHYSGEVRKMAEKMIDADMIDFLGSDMHNSYYMDLLMKTLREPYLKKIVDSGKLLNHQL